MRPLFTYREAFIVQPGTAHHTDGSRYNHWNHPPSSPHDPHPAAHPAHRIRPRSPHVTTEYRGPQRPLCTSTMLQSKPSRPPGAQPFRGPNKPVHLKPFRPTGTAHHEHQLRNNSHIPTTPAFLTTNRSAQPWRRLLRGVGAPAQYLSATALLLDTQHVGPSSVVNKTVIPRGQAHDRRDDPSSEHRTSTGGEAAATRSGVTSTKRVHNTFCRACASAVSRAGSRALCGRSYLLSPHDVM